MERCALEPLERLWTVANGRSPLPRIHCPLGEGNRLAHRLLDRELMVAKYRAEVNQALKGGTFAGFVGGVVLAILLLILMTGRGADPWMVLKGAGAPFLGARAHQPGPDMPAVLTGVICHFAVSIIWGWIFGVVLYGYSRAATVIAGVPFGIVVWLVMYYIVLPLLGLHGGNQSATQGAGLHVIFGLAIAFAFLPFQSSVPRGRTEDRGEGRPTTPIERPV
jgi:hypothetical protein